MIEKGLIAALIAIAVSVAASGLGDRFDRLAHKIECATEHAQICIYDEKAP